MLRFIFTPFSVLLALVSWLFIIGLAGGLGDFYAKLILDGDHQIPPASITILIPSILFFLGLFFEHLPCLKNYWRLGLKNFHVIAIWAWIAGMVINSILVVVIFFQEKIALLLIGIGFDELFSFAAATGLMLPAAVIRFCAMLQCYSYSSKGK